MRQELQKKIDQSIRFLQTFSNNYGGVIELGYSGGKDSDVILQLAREAGINIRPIYKCTTIDQPGTIKHAQEMGVEIVMPKQTFAQLVAIKGMPNRKRRFCCDVLKEYKIMDKVIIGVRREESAKRAERYKEPTTCRIYGEGCKTEQILPILEWTTIDVAEFLQDRNIKCAPIYYDEQGIFHPERRLGCLGCPLASRGHRIAELITYPGIVKLYIKACKQFFSTHQTSKAVTDNNYDPYAYFARNVFYDGKPITGDLFDTDWKKCFGDLFPHNTLTKTDPTISRYQPLSNMFHICVNNKSMFRECYETKPVFMMQPQDHVILYWLVTDNERYIRKFANEETARTKFAQLIEFEKKQTVISYDL